MSGLGLLTLVLDRSCYVPGFVCIRSELMKQISPLCALAMFRLPSGSVFLAGFLLKEMKAEGGLQEYTSCAPATNKHPVLGNQDRGT